MHQVKWTFPESGTKPKLKERKSGREKSTSIIELVIRKIDIWFEERQQKTNRPRIQSTYRFVGHQWEANGDICWNSVTTSQHRVVDVLGAQNITHTTGQKMTNSNQIIATYTFNWKKNEKQKKKTLENDDGMKRNEKTKGEEKINRNDNESEMR